MDLQKGPLGILGWFALKVTGRNPPAFGDSVLPVVEVGDNYLATSELQLQTAQPNIGIGASSATSTFAVPQGKVWRVIGAGLVGGTNIADVAFTSLIAIYVKSPNSGVISVPIASGAKDPGGQSLRQFGATFRPPIFLPSGWSLQVNITFNNVLTVAAGQNVGVMLQEFDL